MLALRFCPKSVKLAGTVLAAGVSLSYIFGILSNRREHNTLLKLVLSELQTTNITLSSETAAEISEEKSGDITAIEERCKVRIKTRLDPEASNSAITVCGFKCNCVSAISAIRKLIAEVSETEEHRISFPLELGENLEIESMKSHAKYDLITEQLPNIQNTLILLGTKRQLKKSIEFIHSKAINYYKIHLQQPTALETGMKYYAYVSAVVDPSHFYVQIIDENSANDLDSLQNDLNTADLHLSPILTGLPLVDIFCCAPFDEDSSSEVNDADATLYRARVLREVSDGSCLVHYVDYGNEATVPYKCLRELPARFSEMPCQAVQCQLALPSSAIPRIWTPEVSRQFSASCHLNQWRPIEVLVVDQNPECDVIVRLFEPSSGAEITVPATEAP